MIIYESKNSYILISRGENNYSPFQEISNNNNKEKNSR